MIEESIKGKKDRSISTDTQPKPVIDIEIEYSDRIITDVEEFDRVLGGGIVKGSLILIGGDPGIGKSTLLLQVMNRIGNKGYKILYVSGEESVKQIGIRAKRLNVDSKSLYILGENSLESIIEKVNDLTPDLLVIDSIQSIFTDAVDSISGSVSQLREITNRLMYISKNQGISTFIIGHVTKEGAIAGPKLLEHMVDTVLYFEGDKGYQYRIIRSIKNRFGPINEIGVFEMKENGLREVINPSEFFLSERVIDVPGISVVATMEGSRPILVELQSLVAKSGFGIPKRTAIGVDFNRLSLLIAVLEKRLGMNLSSHDIFINVAGGIRINEPAIDLGILSSIVSGFIDKPLDSKTVILGEVGLAGEIRGISQVEARVKEITKLGFNRCMLPIKNVETIRSKHSIELIGIKGVKEAINILF
jgi:DNA repair protein RadA/Sms